MTIKQIALVTSLALVATAPVASAAEWYILDASRHCVHLPTADMPLLRSPDDVVKGLRNEGEHPVVKTFRDGSKEVYKVTVEIKATTVMFYRDLSMCEFAMGALERLHTSVAGPALKSLTGEELWASCSGTDKIGNSTCLGYAKAIADQLTLLSTANNLPDKLDNLRIDCRPPNYDDKGLLVAARRYLLDHLKELTQPASSLMQQALIDPLTCHPGKVQDENSYIYATGAILAVSCASKDEAQYAQCVGYLRGIYDYNVVIFNSVAKMFPSCEAKSYSRERLQSAFFDAVTGHPEYLKAPAANVITAFLTPPAPCPLGR
jgi:Rap1a immunity proteins